MYKIQVYIPLESVDTIREVITQAGGGRIGNYAGCMSWWQVHSSWTSLPGAHPYDAPSEKQRKRMNTSSSAASMMPTSLLSFPRSVKPIPTKNLSSMW